MAGIARQAGKVIATVVPCPFVLSYQLNKETADVRARHRRLGLVRTLNAGGELAAGLLQHEIDRLDRARQLFDRNYAQIGRFALGAKDRAVISAPYPGWGCGSNDDDQHYADQRQAAAERKVLVGASGQFRKQMTLRAAEAQDATGPYLTSGKLGVADQPAEDRERFFWKNAAVLYRL